MKIGNLAKKVGITVETIRFYESKKIIPAAKRESNGYRKYNEEHYKALVLIGKLKSLGFTLREIKELLSLQIKQGCDCSRVEKRLEAKNKEIEQKITDLKLIQSSIKQLEGLCKKGCSPKKSCNLLDCMGKKA